ncbi:MAG TPA: sugar ABC transporter substrate-binding protein [Actinomycetota bacterium]|jgi:multiple sugar transport system substrate-binding protein|nr:sugar ABC transporter substrate-binding protein [Actinomycetota bacterium]
MFELRRVVAVLLMLIPFASCSTDRDAGEGARAGEALVVQVSGETEEVAVYRAAARAFEEDNPDIDVRLVGVASKDDHLSRLVTAFSGGTPPDVFLVNFREYAQFVTRGAIEPIEGHLADAGIDRAEYFAPPLEAFTYDGALQCMPQNISSLVVYYNKTLFQRVRLDEPDGSWDWVGFRETARALTGDGVHGLGIEPSIIRLAPFVWANGGDIVDDPQAPERFTLSEPRARAALEYVVALVHDGLVPSADEVAAQDLETRFASGKLGMYLSSRRDTPVFREITSLDWDVAPLPSAPDGGRAGILHSDAYCIAAGTEHLDAAIRFVGFMTGRQGASITALGGRTVPSLRSVARSGAFLDPSQPPARSEVFLESIPIIRRTPVMPTWPEIEAVAEQVLTRAFYEDGYSVEDAISDLDRLTRPLFREGRG